MRSGKEFFRQWHRMVEFAPTEVPDVSSLLTSYPRESNGIDEMLTSKGGVNSHWEHFMRGLAAMGPAGLDDRQREARRFLRENGVTYNVYGDPVGAERFWELDPIPVLITSQEWALIESGLSQRAELLDLILADLYGPRKLIASGLIPPELIFGHPSFLLPCYRSLEGTSRHLHLYAADLVRTPGGSLYVIGDRTQAPSGAGYALENRIIMSRILPSLFRDSQVHRLALFFRTLRNSLSALGSDQADNPRVILLTPGSVNETYFEHSYLANYLGYTLAQGNDLTVRDGRVWLKTLDGLQQADVILRRVDDDFCDPLELRKDSLLGTPGLLQAVRGKGVAISNPLGSGILENPGLLTCLPAVAKSLLGQDLRIPSAPTWWCGRPKDRKHVLTNLRNLVIKPVSPHRAVEAVFGGLLSEGELDQLGRRIRANPTQFVGQAQVDFSTTPTFIDGKLQPRPLVLRSFLVAREDSYVAMPGGLARVSPTSESFLVSNQRGGISKDTWVLASEKESQVTLLSSRQPVMMALTRAGGEVPSRVADNLFWLGRYAERAESNARLLRQVLTRLIDSEGIRQDLLPVLLGSVTHQSGTYPGFTSPVLQSDNGLAQEQELLSVMLDPHRIGSVRFNVNALTQCAWSVRDRLSDDTWRVITNLDDDLHPPGRATPTNHAESLECLERLILSLAAFAGLSAESMSRGQGFHFVDIGRRIERAISIIALLRGSLVWPTSYKPGIWEALLAIADSRMTYNRRYRLDPQPGPVLDLLLQDESNPRSVGFQLVHLRALCATLPGQSDQPRVTDNLVLDALAALRTVDVDSLAEFPESPEMMESLDKLLARLFTLLTGISESIGNSYFSHTDLPRQLVEIQ